MAGERKDFQEIFASLTSHVHSLRIELSMKPFSIATYAIDDGNNFFCFR